MTAGSVLGGPSPPLEKRQLQGDVPAAKQLSAQPHLLVVPLFMDCGDCQEFPHAERERRTKSEAEVRRKCRTVELSPEVVDEGNCSSDYPAQACQTLYAPPSHLSFQLALRGSIQAIALFTGNCPLSDISAVAKLKLPPSQVKRCFWGLPHFRVMCIKWQNNTLRILWETLSAQNCCAV